MIKQNPHEFYLLIVAAGQGERLGGNVPKQYLTIHGKPVLRHTVEAFLRIPGLKDLRVVIHPDHKALYKDTLQDLGLPPPVSGGKTRKESIYNGLKSFSDIKFKSKILTHDAARPCVRTEDISNLLETLEREQAATLCVPATDTLRRSENMRHQTDIPRDGLYGIQTPQGFHYGLLKDAHEKADPDKTYTDDTALVMDMGTDVKLVPGARSNVKLTTAEDLPMIEKLLQPQTLTRTGAGYDVHAFENNPDRPLMLCGVEIPSPLALTGHSDADAGLHAITDALLGALALGDIGDHFPPSDPAFRDMDSAVFLQKACDLVCEKGGRISNIDLTLICEEPKIGPHKKEMQARIAGILNISPDQIGIKATTTEGLGFTGRKEGLVAQAVVAVSIQS